MLKQMYPQGRMSHHFREMRVGDYLAVKGPKACTSFSNVDIMELFLVYMLFCFQKRTCGLQKAETLCRIIFFTGAFQARQISCAGKKAQLICIIHVHKNHLTGSFYTSRSHGLYAPCLAFFFAVAHTPPPPAPPTNWSMAIICQLDKFVVASYISVAQWHQVK